MLAEFIWDDLLSRCPTIRHSHEAGALRHMVNYRHEWPNTAKTKTVDLAIGIANEEEGRADPSLSRVLISCELKTVMTEHQKSQPRIFDELSSSHLIVHTGDQNAIAAGLTVVNIAPQFASPLRQRAGAPIQITHHKQPQVAEGMVTHLRGLKQRDDTEGTGFEAYSTFIINCDNLGPAHLWTGYPSPQPGEKDHYEVFLSRICEAYIGRFT
jgi:hypothetical protein